MIPFNRPFLTGNETAYITEAVLSGKISGNGIYTKKCHDFFSSTYGFHKCLLTTSCTDALEMAAILANIQPGDEVIIPSYTFVSTAIAFIRQGANVIFADSHADQPNIDENKIELLITSKTKAIVPVHYAGVACDMDKIMDIARRYDLLVIEDAAQAIDSYYKGKPLGSIGHLGCFSFHETKNVIAGEGGLLAINDPSLAKRSEILWEKGTNRAEFFRGEINKYGWVDIGSSFLPSEIIAAFLYAQLENIDKIQAKRRSIWNRYFANLEKLEREQVVKLPVIPDYATNNGHMFYMICKSLEERNELIAHMKSDQVLPVFHYQSLHASDYYRDKHDGRVLSNSDMYSDCLVRLPFYYELSLEEVDMISTLILEFYTKG